jgi:hypothetical protein
LLVSVLLAPVALLLSVPLVVVLLVLVLVLVLAGRPNSAADSAPSPSLSSAAIGSARWPIDAVLRCTSNCAGSGGGPGGGPLLATVLLALLAASAKASPPLVPPLAAAEAPRVPDCCAKRCIKAAMLLPLTEDVAFMKVLSGAVAAALITKWARSGHASQADRQGRQPVRWSLMAAGEAMLQAAYQR